MGEGSTVHREAFRGYAACMSLQAGPGGWERGPHSGRGTVSSGHPPPNPGKQVGGGEGRDGETWAYRTVTGPVQWSVVSEAVVGSLGVHWGENTLSWPCFCVTMGWKLPKAPNVIKN